MPDLVYFPGLVPTTFPAVAEFLTSDDFARKRLAVADDVLGYSLVDAYAKADVYDWEVYEAGYLALNLALADRATAALDLDPAVYGGQSFGAIVGAVFGGVLGYADALRLVQESTRVEIDYFEHLAEPLGCFFFYRLDATTVDSLVADCVAAGHRLEVSIYLDNRVHAVSGSLDGLALLKAKVQAAGGFPFYLMNRAEHCSMVGDLRARLDAEVYGQVAWRHGRLPMLSDVSGRLLTDAGEVREDLLDGWITPVRWSTVVDGIRSSGADRAVVIGPRSMFGRLTGNSLPTVVVTPASLRARSHTDTAAVVPSGAQALR